MQASEQNPNATQDSASSSEATRIAQLEAENAMLNRQIWFLVDMASKLECVNCQAKGGCLPWTKGGNSVTCGHAIAVWARKQAEEQQKKGEPYGVYKKVELHSWMA